MRPAADPLFPGEVDADRFAGHLEIVSALFNVLPPGEALTRLHAGGDLMLKTDQVRALHAAGMDIGAHTVTHPILSRIPSATARREIADGRDALEGIYCSPVLLFAYPNGKRGSDYSDDHVAIVRSTLSRQARDIPRLINAHGEQARLDRLLTD